LGESLAVFHSYQEYRLTPDSIAVLPEDAALQRKQALLAPFFQPRHLAHRSVLDLGANAAFFCFWALQNGADRATAVDIDPDYLRMVQEARSRLGFPGLHAVEANVGEWDEPADV